MKLRKVLAGVLCAVCAAAMLAGCADESSSSSSGKDKSSSKIKQEKIVESCIVADNNFDVYVSNTYVATGNNYMIRKSGGKTYRAYLPVEEYGELEYAFYFSNTVDSTYNDGSRAYAGQPGGEYTIESAFVYDGGEVVDGEHGEKKAVTFGGSVSREVAGGETFWSDPVTVDVPEGHYLVWEWTVKGEDIPCIKMSNLTSSTVNEHPENGEEDAVFKYTDEIPLPVYIGAKREVKARITAIGDSITQGCMTDFMEYEFWAARIAKNLGSDYAFYNAGLGWARASDCAMNGNWLGRSLNCELAIVAFGTNDIGAGAYGSETGDNADTINSNIAAILEQFRAVDASVILFNSPPQDYQGALEDTRTTLNELEKTTAESAGASYFDFASVLCDESDPSVAFYGQHPDGEGGAKVCMAFMKQFFPDIKTSEEQEEQEEQEAQEAQEAMAAFDGGYTDDGYTDVGYTDDGYTEDDGGYTYEGE